MAYLKASLKVVLNLQDLKFEDYFDGAKFSEQSDSHFHIKGSKGRNEDVEGSGFFYSNGVPFTGTAKTFKSYHDNDLQFQITELKFKISDPDQYSFKSIFSKNDKMTGSNKSDFLRGYDGKDELRGYDGKDVLRGDDGNDTLKGGNGKDTLTGGKGDDKFVFDTDPLSASNSDRIKDFEHGSDKIAVENRYFHGMHQGENDSMASKYFADYSAKDTDTKARIFYDSAHGDLYYDRDGAKTKYDIVKFAHVDAHDDTPVTLAASDFLII